MTTDPRTALRRIVDTAQDRGDFPGDWYEVSGGAIDAARAALATPPAPEPSAALVEATCQRCGRPNPVWSAPSDLWNAVMGGPDGIVCPSCFAAASDPAIVWSFRPSNIEAPAGPPGSPYPDRQPAGAATPPAPEGRWCTCGHGHRCPGYWGDPGGVCRRDGCVGNESQHSPPATEQAARAEGLDGAWAEVERLLPEGWRMQAVYKASESVDDDRWCAVAYGPEDLEWADPVRGHAPDPITALRNLAQALAARARRTPEAEG